MFIFASPNEINDVVEYFRPGFPKQHLESIEKECFYVFNEVPVCLRLIPNGSESDFAECADLIFQEIDKKVKEQNRTMLQYELPAAIEQAVATMRVRHPDLPLYLSYDDTKGYLIRFNDPDTGFQSDVFVPRDIYRDRVNYEQMEVELIALFEETYNKMTDILEGKTCAETAN